MKAFIVERYKSVNLRDAKIKKGEFKPILIGAFAERIAIREDSLALKPETLTLEEAASVPLVGLTAWQALLERADLRKGQKVFIQAGSGGVGTFAIQLAKHLGAFVATTTSAANAAWVKGLGADLVIDYKKDDFSTILKDYGLSPLASARGLRP